MGEDFLSALREEFDRFTTAVATDSGEWIVKGFIDVYRNIYTISVDTKVISKIIELTLFPVLARFAEMRNYRLILSEYQNHYPDMTFVSEGGERIAVDVKSTYRVSDERVNGLTLGAFTGYFRQRASNKNIRFPYDSYTAHLVLGIVYSRSDDVIDEQRIYNLDELHRIASVVRDFRFFVHEKWRIASDQPGSGNTKNIGSVKALDGLIAGNGPFSAFGEAVFDDYWQNYLTADMARAIDSEVRYRNLNEYWQWRERIPRRHP
ncbi:MAG: restriction endonuclease [Chloroflexi bacterium]|nr:MAG: restriction endonuclease [Chloroflexota bacterium]